MNKLFLFLILGILLSTSAIAVSPFLTQESDSPLTIKYPLITSSKVNTYFKANFHVFNSTSGLALTNSTVDCLFHLYDAMGNHQLILNDSQIAFDHDVDFEVYVDGGNFSKIGVYSYIMQCNTTTTGGFLASDLLISASGEGGFGTDGTAGISITLFLLVITLGLIILPFKYEFSKDISLQNVFSRGCWVISTYLTILNFSILSNIAVNSGLVATELFRYMSLFGFLGYGLMVYMVIGMLFDILKFKETKKQNKRFSG